VLPRPADWVSLPTVLGMSQYGDGGIVGSKPYAASVNSIDRMSDYCRGAVSTPSWPPARKRARLQRFIGIFLRATVRCSRITGRMRLQLANLDRKDAAAPCD